MGVSLLTFFFSLMIPELFSYLSTKEMQKYSLLYAFGTAFLTFLTAAFLFHRLLHEADQEIENHLLDIVSEDYSEVKALKDFSMVEYRHAVKVSDIACRCAKEVGYRANLCLAGGFYYRMGRWIGEPYIKNAVNKAESLCFPAELISILAEYYGEEQLPSSPESALVHMVDAVVIRLEAMEQNVGQSVWNRDIVIYQTVNDFSSSELYDHSGMSMNQFLKIREFLAKEELLR